MSNDLGFSFKKQGDDYFIYRNGKKITVLRGDRAKEFQQVVDVGDFHAQQQLMARLTGNYKRGNERTAKQHQRNR